MFAPFQAKIFNKLRKLIKYIIRLDRKDLMESRRIRLPVIEKSSIMSPFAWFVK